MNYQERLAEIQRNIAARNAEIVDALWAGETVRSLAEKHNLTAKTVMKIRKELGGPINEVMTIVSLPQMISIQALRAKRMKIRDIADRVGLTFAQVSRAIERRMYGLDCPIGGGSSPIPYKSTHTAPSSAYDPPPKLWRLKPTRVIGWGGFGPEVESADAAMAAKEAAPLYGGRYPKSSSPRLSIYGSPAAMCAEN